MDRLLSPPSLSSRLASDVTWAVVSQPDTSSKLRALFRLQLTWFFGLLVWIGFWDASDLLYAYMNDLDGVPLWLWPLIEVILGAAGLAVVMYASHKHHPRRAIAACSTSGRGRPASEPRRSQPRMKLKASGSRLSTMP